MFGILRLLTITSKGSHPLFESLSKDVSLTELYQQIVENTKFVENLSRYFNAFENLIECFAWVDFNTLTSCQQFPFHVLVYLSSDQYEDVLQDFVQTKNQVRTDSLTAGRMLPSTTTLKALKGKTGRQNASTGPTRALVAWQRGVMPWFDSSCHFWSWKVEVHLHTQRLEILAIRL